MELVISDGILFLDEPTDGLDEPSSIAIVRTLKKLVLIVGMSISVARTHCDHYTHYSRFCACF